MKFPRPYFTYSNPPGGGGGHSSYKLLGGYVPLGL